MSTAAKVTLACTSLGAVAIVTLVHYQQTAEKAVSLSLAATDGVFPKDELVWNLQWLTVLQAMHAGVIRDIEQQRIKKERQADFEMQRALEEEYRKVQQVHDGPGGRENAGSRG